MMFVGYVNCKSDGLRMWDSHTTRRVVTCDVIWLKRMFFKDDISGVVELESLGKLMIC